MFCIKGFNNVGNTCYLNAGSQLLIQNKDFCKIVLKNEDKFEDLSKLINEYYNSNNKNSITPFAIKNMAGSKYKRFKGNDQQDAQDLMNTLMDILNEKTNDEFNSLFQIQSKITNKCKLTTCLNTSTIIDKNNFLILPIKKEFTDLNDCYREYKIHEKLEDDDMYFCEKCNDKRVGSRKLEVATWPKHLIVFLKRFDNNLKKIDNIIEVPINWRHGYVIKGAVIQTGSLNGGHYTYVSRILETDGTIGWRYCDDSNVGPIDESKAQMFLNRSYIIYYEKQDE